MSEFWWSIAMLWSLGFVVVRVGTTCTPFFYLAQAFIYLEAAWGQLESCVRVAFRTARVEYGGMVREVKREMVS